MTTPRKPRLRTPALIAALLAAFLFLSGCEDEGGGSAQESGQSLTERAFKQQQAAVPYPADELTDSTERRNLAARLTRTNDPNRQAYVYVMNYGQIVGYYAIKGKVSSTQSQMTATNLVIDRYEGDVTVPAPGDDGSYGENEPGIFFFTTDGTMVSTSLDYIESDRPLAIDVPRLSA